MDPTPLRQAIIAYGEDHVVSATWVANNRDKCRVIDVREQHELSGPLGHIKDSENIPLLVVLSHAHAFPKDEPLVLVCRAGRRSGEAASALRRAGVETVASIEGGMLAWNLNVGERTNIVDEEREVNATNLHDAISRANGLPEVSASWVASNIGSFGLLDIRDDEELKFFGKVAAAEHLPEPQFMAQAHDIPRHRAMVLMCASGRRSGRVVQVLESAGFDAVASLEGGLFGWKAAGLETVGGEDI